MPFGKRASERPVRTACPACCDRRRVVRRRVSYGSGRRPLRQQPCRGRNRQFSPVPAGSPSLALRRGSITAALRWSRRGGPRGGRAHCSLSCSLSLADLDDRRKQQVRVCAFAYSTTSHFGLTPVAVFRPAFSRDDSLSATPQVRPHRPHRLVVTPSDFPRYLACRPRLADDQAAELVPRCAVRR